MTLGELEASHPRFKGLSAFYRQELQPFLAQLELSRGEAYAKLKRHSAVTLPGAVAGIGAIWWFGGFDAGWVGWLVAVVVVVATLGWLAYLTAGVNAIQADMKQQLMSRLCPFLDLTYNAEPVAPHLDWFRSLDLVPGYDREDTEDQIEGTSEGVEFSFCEAHLEDKRTRRDSDGRTETYYVTVFRGLLARFTFPKSFAARTVLLGDGGMLGNLFSGFGKDGERVRLEDPRFEKKFQVFSTDQVEARYLLTPTFMERVTALADLIDGRLQLAFDQDRLLLSVHGGEDRFEAGPMSARMDDPDVVARFVGQIGFAFEIISALKLDASSRI